MNRAKAERQRALVNLFHPGAASGPETAPEPSAAEQTEPSSIGFDGGARLTPEPARTEEQVAREHGELLAGLLGAQRVGGSGGLF